jgi:hypothetical protein
MAGGDGKRNGRNEYKRETALKIPFSVRRKEI